MCVSVPGLRVCDLPDSHPSALSLPAARSKPRTRQLPLAPVESSAVWTASFSGGMQGLPGAAPSVWEQIHGGWRAGRRRWRRSRPYLRSLQLHSEAAGDWTRWLFFVHVGCGDGEDEAALNAHGREAVASMALDSSQRRPITGSRRGTIKVHKHYRLNTVLVHSGHNNPSQHRCGAYLVV